MKNSFVSALSAGLLAAAPASVAFAAANPFEDLAADHWAYDAVAQLAADGVIEGYGDGTYRGDQEITRYEMAQMTARAMAKNSSGADKVLVDRLAAEFSEELNSLGVRVAALEKKVDNVTWRGILRYRFVHRTNAASPSPSDAVIPVPDDNVNVNQLLLRLEPRFRIDGHWTGRARINYGTKENIMDSAANAVGATVDRLFAEGEYENLRISLGKIFRRSEPDFGMVLDGSLSGGSLVVGKEVKAALSLGRLNDEDNRLVAFGDDASAALPGVSTLNRYTGRLGTASYGSLEIYNDRGSRFIWGLGWHNLRQRHRMEEIIDRGDYSILTAGLGYRLTKDLKLTAAYAHALGIDEGRKVRAVNASWAGDQKTSYSLQLDYKGAVPDQKNSWGAFVAWRQLGGFSTMGWNSYKVNGGQDSGTRGLEIGLAWTPMRQFMARVNWFNGLNMNVYDGMPCTRVSTIFTELCFFF